MLSKILAGEPADVKKTYACWRIVYARVINAAGGRKRQVVLWGHGKKIVSLALLAYNLYVT